MEEELKRRIPSATEELERKHQEQIERHEKRFGKLGELQSKKQRASLARSLEGRGN